MKKGSVVLLVILAVAALFAFLFIAYQAKVKKEEVEVVPAAVEDVQVSSLKTTSSSDEVVDIQQDLDSTSLENLDMELSEISQDLGSLQ